MSKTAADSSKSRFGVLVLLFTLSMITYFDRICISVAAPAIMDRLKLSAFSMSMVFSAFTLTYSLFEVPSGWLGDRIGARKALTRIVLCWSAFTMLTGAAWSFGSLLVARLLFGAGEAGAFPNISRSVASWFPAHERGRVYGLIFTGTRIGGAIAPIAVVGLIMTVGWRLSFVYLGILGPIWGVFWYFWYRDTPVEKAVKSPSQPALEHNGEETEVSPVGSRPPTVVPWRQLLSNPTLILLCFIYFTIGYGLYFYLTWLPTYLVKVWHFSPVPSGLLAGMPLLFGAVGAMVGGWLTDRLSHRYNRRISRCLVGATGLIGSAVMIGVVPFAKNGMAAALSIALAAGFADLAIPACWAVCNDLSSENSGVVSGFMNMLGNIGGTISPLVTGYVIDTWRDWRAPFLLTSLMYAVGVFLWLMLDPDRGLRTKQLTLLKSEIADEY
jgi:MFS transporter, ACS family, glucarate transporter